ncbi:MAG: exosortase A [Pseudomonadota bacterium]
MGVGLLVVVVYWQSYASLWWQWQQGDHAHGLVVIPIAVFLIWRSRIGLSEVQIRPSALGLGVVVALVALWIVARMVAVQVVEHLAALALVPAGILAVLGRELSARIAFPLLFLVFAVPISDAFVPLLMQVTADISTFLLRLFGTPVYREGQYLTLPGGRFVVADVCSGVRYLMAGLIVTSLFSYNCFMSPLRRLLFVAVAGIILVFANGLRAFLVMQIASATELEYMGGRDHVVFGWVLFAIIIFALLWFGGRYADRPSETEADEGAGERTTPSDTRSIVALALALVAGTLIFTMRPLLGEYGAVSAVIGLGLLMICAVVAVEVFGRRRSIGSDQASGRRAVSSSGLAIVTMTIAVMFAGPLLTNATAAGRGGAVLDPPIGPVAGCVGPVEWRENWLPAMNNAAQELSASFDCDGLTVSVYLANYANPRPQGELISSKNRLYPEDWDPYQRGFKTQAGPAGDRSVVAQLVALPAGDLRTWHWYVVDGTQHTDRRAVKLRQLWALLRQRPAGGKAVVIAVSGARDEQEATRWLSQHAISLGSSGQ